MSELLIGCGSNHDKKIYLPGRQDWLDLKNLDINDDPKEWLTFLRQKSYEEQVGKTSLSDFRYIYKADFEIILMEEQRDTLFFILEAIKE